MQHFIIYKYIGSIKRYPNKNELFRRLIMQLSTTKKSTYNFDLYKALLSANIPLTKMNNVEFKSFLEKYTDEE